MRFYPRTSRRMAQTSLKTYDSNMTNFNSRKIQVYKIVLKNPGITTQKIAVWLKVHPNQISGRLTELKDARMIEAYDKVKIGKSWHNKWRAL